MDEQHQEHIPRRFNWRFLSVLVLIVAVSGAAVYGLHKWQKSRLTVDHRHEAFAALKTGEYEKALGHLGQVLQTDPNDLEAVIAYARTVGKLSSPTAQQRLSQLSQYRRAITIDPTNAEVDQEGLDLFMRFNLWLETGEIAQHVLDADPESRPALIALAKVALHNNEDDRAEELLHRINELYPSDDEALALFVKLYRGRAADQSIAIRNDTLAAMREHVEKVVTEQGSNNPRLYVVRAQMYTDLGTKDYLEKARIDLEKALDLRPNDPVICAAAGEYFRRVGEHDKAVKWLTIAINEDPTNQTNYATLAQAYADRGDYDDAVRILREGMEKAPAGTLLRFYLAEILLTAGKIDEVRPVINELSAQGAPVPLTRYLDARVFLAEGKPGKAIGIFESISDPVVTPLSQFFMAEAYMQLGLPRRAWARVTQIPPGQFDPLVLGRLQLDVMAANGMYREAVRKADELIRKFPDDPELLFLKADGLMGMLASGQGDAHNLQQLEDLYKKISVIAGNDVRTRLLRSRIAQLSGNKEQARFDLEKDIAQTPESLELYSELIRLHLQDGRIEDALKLLNTAPEKIKDKPLYRILLARVYEKNNELEKAIDALTENIKKYTSNEQKSLFRLAANLLQDAGKDSEAVDLLVKAAASDPSDIDLRVSLLAMPHVQQNIDLRNRLIDEIRQAESSSSENDSGVVWKIEQARALLLDPASPDPEKAQVLLDEVLKVQPENSKALHLLALTYRQQGKIDDAIEYAQRALHVQPDQNLTKLMLVDLYSKAGRDDEAHKLITELSELEGPKPVLLVRGSLDWSLRTGQTKSAIKDARLLVNNDPNNPRLRVLLAQLLAADGQMQNALLEAQHAYKIAPDFVDGAITLVTLALKLKDFDLAKATTDKLAEVKPDSDAVYLLRGDISSAEGDDEAVLNVLREGLKQNKSSTIRLALARYLVRMGRFEEALKQYDEIGRDSPHAVDAALESATLLLQMGDPQHKAESKIALAEAAGADKLKVLSLKWMRLSVLRPAGWLEEAIPILEEMRQYPNPAPEVFMDLAGVYELKGDLDSARRVLEEGVEHYPDNLAVNEQLGNVYVKTGQLDKAKIKAAYLASLPDGEISARLLQVQAFQAQQNYNPAIVQLKSLINSYPDDPRVAQWRMQVLNLLEQQGDNEQIRSIIGSIPVEKRDDALNERWAVYLLRTQGAEQAVKYLQERIKEHPDSKQLHFVLARMLLTEPPDKRDIQLLQTSIDEDRRLNPGSARSVLLMASEAREKQDFQKAVKIYQQALTLEPDNPVAINNLAWTLGKDLNRLPEALKLLHDGLARDPGNQQLMRTYGILLVDARQWQDALDIWQKLARQNRTDIYLKLRIVEADLQLGKVSDARHTMGEVSDILNVLRNGINDLDSETRRLYDQVQKTIGNLGS